jgi:hypothetical protein
MKETLEEAAEIHSKKMWGSYFDDIHPDVAITQTQGEISIQDFIAGAKWQQERMYSEEKVLKLLITFSNDRTFLKEDVAIQWFEQNKKQ